MNHRKLAAGVSKFCDTKRAEKYVTLALKGMKPCPRYADDPTDKGSRYLKNVTAIRDVAIDIIEHSPDQKLVREAKLFLAGTKKLPEHNGKLARESAGVGVRTYTRIGKIRLK